jgi:hypothetical protein
MGTRSSISIRNADGSYTGIYCHWDGYLSHNGRILQEHYTNEAKIRQLMELGSISSLGAEIGEQHDFRNPPEGVCTAYGRDRGEQDVGAVTRSTLDGLLNQISQEYDYVWEDGAWQVRWYDTNGGFVPLATAERHQRVNENVNVSSEDFGGLSFRGPAGTALELSRLLRPVVEVSGSPNYLSDFVFALEVACQDAGLLDEDFNEVA